MTKSGSNATILGSSPFSLSFALSLSRARASMQHARTKTLIYNCVPTIEPSTLCYILFAATPVQDSAEKTMQQKKNQGNQKEFHHPHTRFTVQS